MKSKISKFIIALLIIIIISLIVTAFVLITKKLNSKNSEISSLQEQITELSNQLKEKEEAEKTEEAKKEEVENTVTIDVDAANKLCVEKILKIEGGGDPIAQLYAVMDMDTNTDYSYKDWYNNKINYNGKPMLATNISYSDYQKKLDEIFTKEGQDSFFNGFDRFVTASKAVEKDEKVLVYDTAWSGRNIVIDSIEQTSNDGTNYNYVVKTHLVAFAGNISEYSTIYVEGVIVDGKYKINKISH